MNQLRDLKEDLVNQIGNNKMVVTAGMLAVALIASGCGGGQSPIPNLVKKVEVSTYAKDSDQWTQVLATLDTGNFQMTSFSIPIVDPKDHSRVYGILSSASGLGGGVVDLAVDLNITQASMANTLDPLLPNGTPLPIAGLRDSTIIALPLATNDKTNSKVYFAFGPGVAMLGTAMAFSALDPAGSYVPGVNIFQPFKAGAIGLTAGFFTGATTNTTGIGLFVDLSSVINPSMLASGLGPLKSSLQSKSRLSFKVVKPSRRQERSLGYKLYKMGQSKTRLQLK